MFFGGGGIPLGIDPKDMNKENIDEENIGVLDGTALFHRRLFNEQLLRDLAEKTTSYFYYFVLVR